MKIPVSSFLSYLWSYLAYRDVLYIKLKLLRFCFDLMLSFLAPGSIFVEQLRQEVVSFVFRVAQTVFVPNFYIPLIWQLFFFFLWIFSSYAKELMHMISRKKKFVYLIPFHKTEFSNSFCQRLFYSPFISAHSGKDNKDFQWNLLQFDVACTIDKDLRICLNLCTVHLIGSHCKHLQLEYIFSTTQKL